MRNTGRYNPSAQGPTFPSIRRLACRAHLPGGHFSQKKVGGTSENSILPRTRVNKALPRSDGAKTPKRALSTEMYYVEVSAGFSGEGL